MAEEQYQPLPVPLTNNAVAAVRIDGQLLVYSLMGVGAQKNWKAVTNAAYALNVKYDKWTAVRPAPGSGRLGTVAAAAAEQVFLFGGYVLDPSGLEQIIPDLSIYDPLGLRLAQRTRHAGAGARRGGRGLSRSLHLCDRRAFEWPGPTNQVQIYDAADKKWLQGTPSPGIPIFGHAGAVSGDTIIYVDGAKKNPAGGKMEYVASDECWLGKIDHHDPRKIEWKKLPPHPGSGTLSHRRRRVGERRRSLLRRRQRYGV